MEDQAARAAILEQATKDDPRYAMAWLRLGRHYGVMSFRPNHVLAVAAYSKAIELDPEYEWAWAERAQEYLYSQDNDSAILDFSKAIELVPAYASFWGGRSSAYEIKGDLSHAKADLDKMIELQPGDASNWGRRAEVYEMMGEHERSAADYCHANAVEALKPPSRRFRYGSGPCPSNTPNP